MSTRTSRGNATTYERLSSQQKMTNLDPTSPPTSSPQNTTWLDTTAKSPNMKSAPPSHTSDSTQQPELTVSITPPPNTSMKQHHTYSRTSLTPACGTQYTRRNHGWIGAGGGPVEDFLCLVCAPVFAYLFCCFC